MRLRTQPLSLRLSKFRAHSGVVGLLLATALAGCMTRPAASPPVPAPSPSPPVVQPMPPPPPVVQPLPVPLPIQLSAVTFADLEGWAASDPRAALLAFKRSCAAFSNRAANASLGGGNYAGTTADWREACDDARRNDWRYRAGRTRLFRIHLRPLSCERRIASRPIHRLLRARAQRQPHAARAVSDAALWRACRSGDHRSRALPRYVQRPAACGKGHERTSGAVSGARRNRHARASMHSRCSMSTMRSTPSFCRFRVRAGSCWMTAASCVPPSPARTVNLTRRSAQCSCNEAHSRAKMFRCSRSAPGSGRIRRKVQA